MHFTCTVDSCNLKATFVPKMHVPPKTNQKASPLTGLLNLPLCEDHARQMRVAYLLEIPGVIELWEQGWASPFPPNFDRSWLSLVYIDSDEFKSYLIVKEDPPTTAIH